MKGLNKIPTTKQLESVYLRLLKEETFSEKKLCLYVQWSRFDPRLAEILTTHFQKNWKELSAIKLNTEIKKFPWASALGVILEEVFWAMKSTRAKKDNLKTFQIWKSLAMSTISPANNEQFFIGLRKFAGKLIREDTLKSHRSYRYWGYFGTDVLINKANQFADHRFTRVSKEVRKRLILSLIQNKKELTVNDYLNALNQMVSRRQAQRDLLDIGGLVPVGNTRNRHFVSKPTSKRPK